MFKILIIDDCREDAELTEKVLFKNLKDRVDVTKVCAGEEALDLLKKEDFNLIITDYCIPKLSGLELIKRVRLLNQDIEVIFLSDDEGDRNVERYILDTKKAKESIPGPPIIFLGKPASPIIFTEYVNALLCNDRNLKSQTAALN